MQQPKKTRKGTVLGTAITKYQLQPPQFERNGRGSTLNGHGVGVGHSFIMKRQLIMMPHSYGSQDKLAFMGNCQLVTHQINLTSLASRLACRAG